MGRHSQLEDECSCNAASKPGRPQYSKYAQSITQITHTVMNGHSKDDCHKDNHQDTADGRPISQAVQVGHAHGEDEVGCAKSDDPVGQCHAVFPVQVVCALQGRIQNLNCLLVYTTGRVQMLTYILRYRLILVCMLSPDEHMHVIVIQKMRCHMSSVAIIIKYAQLLCKISRALCQCHA